jgi:hypothetical protein
MLVEPAAALDELGAVIAEMRDGAAEARQPKAQGDAKYLSGRPRMAVDRWGSGSD